MIATLKSSPEGDLFGRNRSLSLYQCLCPCCEIPPLFSKDPSLQDIIYKSHSLSPFFSGFCTSSCSSTMTAQKTVYLSQRRITNYESNLTLPFTSTSGGCQMFSFSSFTSCSPFSFLSFPALRCINVSCFGSMWSLSSYQYLMSPRLTLLSIAPHLVGTGLCLTSRAVRLGMKARAISRCLRMQSRASSAPKWRTVRDEMNTHLWEQMIQLPGL